MNKSEVSSKENSNNDECSKQEKQYTRKADRAKAITEYRHQYKCANSLKYQEVDIMHS